jgi:signal transduction histidine kinase
MQTPVAVMLGLMHALTSDRGLSREQEAEIYSTMQRQLILLRHLVWQFVDYARLKSGGRLEFDPKPSDVAHIVEEVRDAHHGDTQIELELPKDLPPAVVDPVRLKQVLMNLVSNAAKFSPQGAPVRISAHSSASSVNLEVIDLGPGISALDQPDLFAEAVPEGLASEMPGAGIGLYMARMLTEPQGASVTVDSRPGEGSCFQVVLPRA